MGDLAQRRTLSPPCPAVSLRHFRYHLWQGRYTTPNARMSEQGFARRASSRVLPLAASALMLVLWLSGCSFGQSVPTRTPVPTWTPTSVGQAPPQAGAPATQAPVAEPATATEPPPPAVDTPTVEATPTPVPTDTPAETPTPAPTDTPAETPTPEPTATSAYTFVLEAAEKFPTDSLAANVVRIYLYVYSPATYGLAGYTLQVRHNDEPLEVNEVSIGGVPIQTRDEPGPYTRFANMTVVFVEPQAGRWEIQLIDEASTPVGPPATFELTADERTRELYVRYVQQ